MNAGHPGNAWSPGVMRPEGAGAALRPIGEVVARGVFLPGGAVECTTCHDARSRWANHLALPSGAVARPAVDPRPPATYAREPGVAREAPFGPAGAAEEAPGELARADLPAPAAPRCALATPGSDLASSDACLECHGPRREGRPNWRLAARGDVPYLPDGTAVSPAPLCAACHTHAD